jgi:hypothetical protein
VSGGLQQLAGARRSLSEASQSDADFLATAGSTRGVRGAILDAKREAEGRREAAELADVGALRRDAARQAVEAERERAGMGFVQDPGGALRNFLVTTGTLSQEQGVASVQAQEAVLAKGGGNSLGQLIYVLRKLGEVLDKTREREDLKNLTVRPED